MSKASMSSENDFLRYYPEETRGFSDGNRRFAFLLGAKIGGIDEPESIYHLEDTTAGYNPVNQIP